MTELARTEVKKTLRVKNSVAPLQRRTDDLGKRCHEREHGLFPCGKACIGLRDSPVWDVV